MYCSTCEKDIKFPDVTLAQESIGGAVSYTCFDCLVTKHTENAETVFRYLRSRITWKVS